jgi:hypothetical protein
MPQYTYPIPAGELTLPLVIGLGADEAQGRISAGQALPSPVWGTGVIDTGTTVTCIAGFILRQLGTMPGKQATSQTATGQLVADLYKVSLSIPAPGPSTGPMLTRRDLLVMEMTQVIPGVEALIGLDVLLEIKLLLDGPARSFTLDF